VLRTRKKETYCRTVFMKLRSVIKAQTYSTFKATRSEIKLKEPDAEQKRMQKGR
jgi:hypothetical protein